MADRQKKYRVFISVAEPSADSHCAGLIEAVKKAGYENIEFVGTGGPKMEAAGCELLETTVGKAAMIYNAFAEVGHFFKLLNRIKRYLRENKVDLVVICDSPGFNWHVAKAARKLGIPTLFYVAPQLWAWASWRIRKLKRTCSRLCCILPFEQQWFAERGMETTYVGNPMVDRLDIDFEQRRDYSGFDAESVKIALMPGSRPAEIAGLWPAMQEMALRIGQRYPKATFTTVAVNEEKRQALEQERIDGFECEYAIGSVHQTCEAVDFAIVTSGSATLEVAAAGCPMVIIYQSNRFLWHLVGRHIVKTRYLSLVNILAGRELVPEFMPCFSSIEPILDAIFEKLDDKAQLTQISSDLKDLVKPLAAKKASPETAKVLLEMLGTGTEGNGQQAS